MSSGLVKNKKTDHEGRFCLEATPRFELGVEVLQTFALPLGHVAVFIML